MKKYNLTLVLIALAILTFTSSCKKDNSPTSYDATKLNAIKVNSAPGVDGKVDALWDEAPVLTVALGETNSPPNDPSKIKSIKDV